MIKKLVFITMIFLGGCTSTLHFDREFGVRYSYDDENSITITLDTENPELITSLSIWVDTAGDGLENSVYPGDIRMGESEPIVYFVNDNFEHIRINPYLDGFDDIDKKQISEYLGFKIKKIMKLSDLLNSKNFKYKFVLEDGEVCNDISFAGFGHEVDEKYYRK